MIAKLILQTLVWTSAMAALLFAAAGTVHWPAAWIYLVTMAMLGLASGGWLARVDPALLAERMRPAVQSGQPAADKLFIAVFGIAAVAWFTMMGRDHRIHGQGIATALQAFGLALLVLSTLHILWVMRTNTFAAPVVKIQSDRGHHVIDSGPYAYVRHPMYSGMALYFFGTPLLLGSVRGVAMAPLLVALFAVRAVIEERALRRGLPGYADYAARVRYRLLPGLW